MSSIILANQYFSQGQFKKAEQVYKQLLGENKTDINALFGLGKVALQLNSFQQAYNLFVRCLSVSTNQPAIYLALATACKKLMQIEKAEQALLAAYRLNETLVNTLAELAVLYCEIGSFDKSERYITELQKVEPENIQAFSLLVRMQKISFNDSSYKQLITKMIDILSSNSQQLSNKDKANLSYSFAELYHRNKQFDQAFKYFNKANEIQLAEINFRVEDMKPFFNSIVNVFDRTLLNTPSTDIKIEEFKDKVTPIFIVGQPRSGSTLLEQLLTNHTEICTGGELSFMAEDIANGMYQITGKEFPHACQQINDKHKSLLGEHYLKQIRSIAPQAKNIIDKMPSNYQSIGLIKQLMPHAKVIHITRNKTDVGWSIFRNNFEALEPYFCSLSEIAEYQKQYQIIMEHWQTIMPEFIHNIAYEDLVENPETAIKNILEFCQLDLQKQCYELKNESAFISTLSDVQLRQGIKKKGNSSWQSYKKYLKPILS
ncbi:sulfotransferase [Thalassotalea psychrophila]|uniref:Sulfotransferase n=1 Tax=Thalassotalea psychrophila TaxID=3065647 RepID=A0ABY9TWG8_9GAMM|nr:sulfotransferase [Colwelliaceae bacterium SQ149]